MRIIFIISLSILLICCQSRQLDLENPCNKLNEIQEIPIKGKMVNDKIYNEILARGDFSLDCLISNITDETIMHDPRKAPIVENFKVGDLALFLFSDISGIPLEEIFPEELKKTYREEGIYAYFKYVEKKEGRIKLQSICRSLTKNRN